MTKARLGSVEILKQLVDLLRLLGRRRRQQLSVLLTFMLASSIADVVTVATAVPLLSILSGQSGGRVHDLIARFSWELGLVGMRQRLLAVSLAFMVLVLIATALKITCQFLSAELSSRMGSELSSLVYRSHLFQTYADQLSNRRESSKVATTINLFTNQASGTLYQSLQLMLSLMLISIMLCSGLLLNWKVTSAAILSLGATYLLINARNQNHLRAHGRLASESAEHLNRSLEQSILRNKEILLEGSQLRHLDAFTHHDRGMRRGRSQLQFLSTYPKAVAEAVILCSTALLAFLSVQLNGGRIANVVPVLGTLALGAQKLLPAIQMAYASWSCINSNSSSVAKVLEMIQAPRQAQQQGSGWRLDHHIDLQQIGFKHRKGRREMLRSISLRLNKGEWAGLIGRSGSGKSTLADIVMGLLPPDRGSLLVDGRTVYGLGEHDNSTRWRQAVSFVGSSVYLLPGTLEANLLCGLGSALQSMSPEDCQERIQEALALADLDDYVAELKDGLMTVVGSGGLNMSQGQQQRVGIARALVQSRSLLILDEATAALDSSCETRIIRRIQQQRPDLTVLLISHRHRSMSHCHQCHELVHGVLRTVNIRDGLQSGTTESMQT